MRSRGVCAAIPAPLHPGFLPERIGALVARGQFRRPLDILDEVIEDPPLFQGEAWVIEERRLAWLYRIELHTWSHGGVRSAE